MLQHRFSILLFATICFGSMSVICSVVGMAADSKNKHRTPVIKESNLLQPIPETAILAEKGYIVWGATMVQTEDETCHMLYCRWRGKLRDWTTNAEIVYATADHPLGPYKPKHVALGREGAADWESTAVYNPMMVRFGDKYYLYYTGSNGTNFPTKDEKGNFKRTPKGTLISQRLGVAVADHPAGPWKRFSTPIIDLSKDGIDSALCSNPSVTKGPDGRYLMIYKCSAGRGKEIHFTTATADSPLGPFTKSNRKILTHPKDPFPLEDPYLWYGDGKYRCLADDQHGAFSGAKGLLLFESVDGQNWTRSEPFVLTRCKIKRANGKTEKTNHLERPFLWFQNGKPAVLFAAASKKKKIYFNVQIPTIWFDEKAAESKKPSDKK